MKTRHKLIEYHGNNRATFECPAGHRRTIALIPYRRKRQTGETGLQMIAGWWRKTGVSMECPRCKS
jgi:hypothetical protein